MVAWGDFHFAEDLTTLSHRPSEPSVHAPLHKECTLVLINWPALWSVVVAPNSSTGASEAGVDFVTVSP